MAKHMHVAKGDGGGGGGGDCRRLYLRWEDLDSSAARLPQAGRGHMGVASPRGRGA
jgi:hypothetical protein